MINESATPSMNKRLLSTSIAILSASIISSNTSAAPIEEIFVTASKRMESVQDIPYNISAITGNDLEAKGVGDLTKLSRTVPGLTYSDKGAQGALLSSGLVIRGINAENGRTTNPNLNVPVISTYINETPIFTSIRLVDLERVEVLRGPQGTLYGSGSLGGTLRYIQREPNPDQFEAKISGEINKVAEGDDLGWKTDLMLNVPLTDNSALRVNLGKEERAGFIDQVAKYQLDANGAPVLADPSDPVNSPALFTSADDVNDVEIDSARVHFMFQTDDVTLNLSHHYQETISGGSQTALADDTTKSGSLLDEDFLGENNLTSLDIEYFLGFATLTANLSTYESENQGYADITGTYEGLPFFPAYYGSGPRPLVRDLSQWDEEADVVELRLSSESEGDIDWAIGAFYMDQDTTIRQINEYIGYTDYSNACFAENPGVFGPNGPMPGPPCGLGTLFGIFPSNGSVDITNANKDHVYLSTSESNFKDTSIFGEVTYHISEEWQATVGFRRFDQEYISSAVAGLMLVPGGVVTDEQPFDEQDTLFKFNTSYDVTDEVMAYFTVSEGFRRGGANGLGAAVHPDVLSYGSDRTTNFELGIKGSINYEYNYTVAAFYVDWEDIQLNTRCGDLALNCVINAGEAETQGIEMQIEGNVTDHISINASYTYTDAVLTSTSPQTQYTFFRLSGGEVDLPGTPKHSASWGATYTTDFNNKFDLALYLGGTYRGKAEGAITANSIESDDFMLWDAFVSLTSEQWSVRLFVDNIGNEEGITYEAPANQGFQGNRSKVNISQPRLIGISGSYSF